MCGRTIAHYYALTLRYRVFQKLINQINSEKAFFIETAHSVLDIRQACAVESLAYHNPNLKIYVLFSIGQINSSTAVMETLIQNYSNIQLIKLDINEYLARTPLENWFHCTNWKKGPHHVPRYLILVMGSVS